VISHLVIVVVSGQSLGCISRWTSHLVVVGVITSHLVIIVVSGQSLGCISRWTSHLFVVGVSDQSLSYSRGKWSVTLTTIITK
jgi:hypothetical protein